MNLRLLPVLLVSILLLSAISADAASKVVKLRSQRPEEVCDILSRLFGSGLRCAPVPSIQAVVIAADSPERVDEAAALLARLDRRPGTMRFSVRHTSTSSRSRTELGLNRARLEPWLESRAGSAQKTGHRSVVGMEGAWLSFTDDTLRLETVPAPWGPETIAITHRQGIEIRGTQSGSGTVIIELRAASGPEQDSRNLLTRVKVPFGQWTRLGDTTEAESSHQDGFGIGNAGMARIDEKSHSSVDGWEVLVDLVEPGDPLE
ncbi:MAG TPA: secretin N-terminal domain-containing protein [Candidatus Ozemobacteraceae bacterium]